MKRIINFSFAIIASFLCIWQPSVMAISQDQVKTFDSGIYYFNTDTSCAASTTTSTTSVVSTGNTLDLAGISKKYGIGWAEVKQLNGSVVGEYNSSDQLPAVASILKLVIADAFLSTKPDLNKTITITGRELYNGPGTGSSSDSDPKAGYQISLRESLKQMLMNSSNTNANAIVDSVGGAKAITAKANQLGYTKTSIGGYYARGGGGNSSTVADLTQAMDKVYTGNGEGYQIAQAALQNENEKWGLDSEANKWAGVSNATGNTAVFNNVNGDKYIITMYDSLNGEQGPNTPGALPIQNATNAVLANLRSSTSAANLVNTRESSVTCTCSVDQSGSVYKFVQTLAFKESGDNPTVQSGSSDASGKYQYMPSTWQSSAKSYYAPASQYSVAKAAPEEIQDAVAYIEYSVKYIEFKGDLTKLAVSHYYPVANNDPSKMDIVPPGNTETPRQYAQNFLDDLNAGKGQDTPLKFATAPDFDTWYSKSVGRPYSASADSSSSGNTTNDCNSSPAGSFVFYDQYDPKWSNHSYGSSTIAASGCGPTSVAMVVATLSNSSVTPIDTADFGTKNGAFIPNKGSDHQKMIIDGVKHWGLKAVSLGTDLNQAANILRQGGLVIAAGTGNSPFSKEGHIIVLRSITGDGKFLVGNPAPNLQNGQDESFSPEDLTSAGLQALYGVTK